FGFGFAAAAGAAEAGAAGCWAIAGTANAAAMNSKQASRHLRSMRICLVEGAPAPSLAILSF
ncbi:MAG: hypothetical protein WAK35_04095, partial [Xanthobacteraceae bacterium]